MAAAVAAGGRCLRWRFVSTTTAAAVANVVEAARFLGMMGEVETATAFVATTKDCNVFLAFIISPLGKRNIFFSFVGGGSCRALVVAMSIAVAVVVAVAVAAVVSVAADDCGVIVDDTAL